MASPKTKGSQSTIRIIGGEWRGRKLAVLDENGLRPTQDRVRETLFNWLATQLVGAQAVDLFAGTGALGLEALSRGAAHVDFIDTNRRATHTIADNLAVLKDTRGQVHCMGAVQWLAQQPDNSVDLIFMDPPFGQNLCQTLLDLPDFIRVLKSHARVYIEHEKSVTIRTTLQQTKEKSTGSLTYSLYDNS